MTEKQQPLTDTRPNVPRTVLQAEQVRLLYAGIPVSLAVNALIASILVAAQRSVLNIEPIIGWCTLLGATLVLRAVFAVAYRHAKIDELTSETWLTQFRVGTAATGIVWGLSSLLLFPAADIPHQSFLLFAIAGMTAGAVTSLSIDLVSSLVFIIPALVPIIARMITEGEDIPVTMGAMGTLYLVALTLNAQRTYIGIRENICMRLDAVTREHDMRENEERLRLIMGTIDEVFWMAEVPIERLHYVSPGYEHIWGRTVRSLYENPRSFIEAIYPEDTERVLSDLDAQKTGQPFDHEYRIVQPDGTVRWVSDRGFPVRDKTGEVTRYAGVMQDITDRKHLEIELRRSEENLNRAQTVGQIGSWVLDIASSRLEWSAETYRMFGIPPQDAIEQEAFLAVTHPDDREFVMNAWCEAMAGDFPFDIEHRIVVGGHTRWVKERAQIEYDPEGRPITGIGTVQDITEHKQMEQEILRINAGLEERVGERTKKLEQVQRETRFMLRRYKTLMMTSMDGIHIMDTQGNIVEANDTFCNMLGYTRTEVLALNLADWEAQLSAEELREGFKALIGKSKLFETLHRRKDGTLINVEVSVNGLEMEGQDLIFATSRDITARKLAEEEIRNLAFYDALTSLPNRRLLLDRFQLALSMSVRSNHYGAVLFLDMDKFKTLNDMMGHEYGDLLLIEVAQRIQVCVREVETVARFGGDEFVVLIEEISGSAEDASQKVALIAEKIRASLAEPYQLKGHEYHSSPSIGVCLYLGNEESVDTLLKHADIAMYQAKDYGRNAVRFFDPSMQHAMETHAALEADLRHAVPEQQLRLHYQIQVDNDNRPLGAEALVRWNHPTRGMVSSAQFIPIAEDSSLILDVDGWVLDTACQQLAVWAKSDLTRVLKLTVNVSAKQFKQHDFVETVAVVLSVHKVEASRLNLELTESVVLHDVTDVATKMQALKALGVRLSMDEFGTGISSLPYLKNLPLDQIKIDQSFVQYIATDPNDAVMVKTIIDLARNFRLNVIADGVETEEQLDFLKQNGCMGYQGYYFGKPVPIDQFESLLKMSWLQH